MECIRCYNNFDEYITERSYDDHCPIMKIK